MGLFAKKYNDIIKKVACVLVITVFAQGIACAATVGTVPAQNLSVQSFSSPITAEPLDNILGVTVKYLMGAVKDISIFNKRLSPKIGRFEVEIDFSNRSVENDRITVPCRVKGEKEVLSRRAVLIPETGEVEIYDTLSGERVSIDALMGTEDTSGYVDEQESVADGDGTIGLREPGVADSSFEGQFVEQLKKIFRSTLLMAVIILGTFFSVDTVKASDHNVSAGEVQVSGEGNVSVDLTEEDPVIEQYKQELKDFEAKLKAMSLQETVFEQMGEKIQVSKKEKLKRKIELEDSIGVQDKRIEAINERFKGQRSGKKAPEFSMNTYDGESFTLSKQRGKVVVVVGWAPWCGPCRREIPHLKSLYEKYNSNGLEIAGVAINSKDRHIRKAIKQYKIPYTIMRDDGKFSKSYGITGLPTILVVDPLGNISAVHTGMVEEEVLEREILAAFKSGKLLAELDSAKKEKAELLLALEGVNDELTGISAQEKKLVSDIKKLKEEAASVKVQSADISLSLDRQREKALREKKLAEKARQEELAEKARQKELAEKARQEDPIDGRRGGKKWYDKTEFDDRQTAFGSKGSSSDKVDEIGDSLTIKIAGVMGDDDFSSGFVPKRGGDSRRMVCSLDGKCHMVDPATQVKASDPKDKAILSGVDKTSSKIAHPVALEKYILWACGSVAVAAIVLGVFYSIFSKRGKNKKEDTKEPWDIVVRDSLGEEISLSSRRGRIVVLNLWAPNEDSSVDQLLMLNGLRKKYDPEQVDVVAVTVPGKKAEALEKFAASYSISVPIFTANIEELISNNVHRTSRLLVLNTDGKMVERFRSSVERSEVERTLDALLDRAKDVSAQEEESEQLDSGMKTDAADQGNMQIEDAVDATGEADRDEGPGAGEPDGKVQEYDEALVNDLVSLIASMGMNNKIVLAFDRDMAGVASNDIMSVIRTIEKLKENPDYSVLLRDVIFLKGPANKLRDKLSPYLEQESVPIFLFARKSVRESFSDMESRLNTVYVDEGSDPMVYEKFYYPLLEIMMITLERYRSGLRSYDRKLLEISNIASISEEERALIFTLIPRAEAKDPRYLIERYAQIKRFIKSA